MADLGECLNRTWPSFLHNHMSLMMETATILNYLNGFLQ